MHIYVYIYICIHIHTYTHIYRHPCTCLSALHGYIYLSMRGHDITDARRQDIQRDLLLYIDNKRCLVMSKTYIVHWQQKCRPPTPGQQTDDGYNRVGQHKNEGMRLLRCVVEKRWGLPTVQSNLTHALTVYTELKNKRITRMKQFYIGVESANGRQEGRSGRRWMYGCMYVCMYVWVHTIQWMKERKEETPIIYLAYLWLVKIRCYTYTRPRSASQPATSK